MSQNPTKLVSITPCMLIIMPRAHFHHITSTIHFVSGQTWYGQRLSHRSWSTSHICSSTSRSTPLKKMGLVELRPKQVNAPTEPSTEFFSEIWGNLERGINKSIQQKHGQILHKNQKQRQKQKLLKER